MTRITNAEQVLMLLRAHLERAQRSGKKRQTHESKAGPLQRVQHLATAEGLSEAELGRALIAGLLAEEFGPEFAVAPRFQSMVEDIRQIIERDENGRVLLGKALTQLRE